MAKWELFFNNIQQDFKLFLFILGVLCLFRGAFIVSLHEYLGQSTNGQDIAASLYYGLRLSLKSAGIITLISFLFCTLVNLFNRTPYVQRIRYGIGCAATIILSILFQVRIPYYEQFHMAFSVFIFNTLKDDVMALFYTLVQQYQLPLRLAGAFLMAFILCRILRKVLNTGTYPMPKLLTGQRKIIFRTGFLTVICLFILFVRFGGSLTYGSGISWESAAKSKDEFLNEAILDDMQALYRAYSINAKMKSGKDLNITKEQILQYGNYLAGYPVQSSDIEAYFKKKAGGPRIKKPKHIFVVVGENYAEWPLLPQYSNLHLAEGMKQVIGQDNSFYIPTFLPASISTMPAINSIVTGFPEINLSPNYQAESYKTVYATSIAAQMKNLGYKTYFWYGGFSSWQRIEDFALAQGFDVFLDSSDLQNQSGNAWGSDDKYFLQAITSLDINEQPTFHMILTTSNHPPYTVNLESENFDGNKVNSGLPKRLKEDQEWINKLGHFWYADKVLANFVEEMYQKYPESLFIITGDHGDRVNLAANPSLYERYAVPLIFYGQGVTKQMLSGKVAGSHIDITATLIELIAPQGFTYYSIGESLTKGKALGINDQLWITPDYIGRITNGDAEPLIWGSPIAMPPNPEEVKQETQAVRATAWWRIVRGKEID